MKIRKSFPVAQFHKARYENVIIEMYPLDYKMRNLVS